MGSSLAFSFELEGTGPRAQDLLVDYVVHFVKADGSKRPKTFKLAKINLPAGGRISLRGKVAFVELTTRKHYPGRHRIEALVNGVAFALGEFQVVG
jgi:hypothetical protein